MARYPEAVREFERVVSAAPDDSEAHYELGLAYGKSGRSEDAIRSFQRALSAASSQELAERAKDALSQVQARNQ
jgi:Flp pilus assembly protein TadD